MSVAILPSEAAFPGRMHGRAELAFVRADGTDRLARLYQQAPQRVLFPDPEAGEPPLAALVTTSGGLAGGDRMELAAQVGPMSSALVMASAAEKIYRSTGPDTQVVVALDARPGGWLEFLPQETILFDAARLRRQTRVDVAAGASVLAGELLVFGRTARGERMRSGLVRDAWEVRRDGRLAWADALHMDGELSRTLDARAGFAGAVACATLVLVADDGPRCRDDVRDWLREYGGRAGASVVNGILVARWLDDDLRRLRASFETVWTRLRERLAGLPPRLPRLWNV